VQFEMTVYISEFKSMYYALSITPYPVNKVLVFFLVFWRITCKPVVSVILSCSAHASNCSLKQKSL